MINPSFWRGKRVFLTGHTGFKGSWLSKWLLMLGAEIRGYSLDPPTQPSLFVSLGLVHEIDHCIGDIRNADELSSSVKDFNPEIVFHMAAQPLVRLSYKEPRMTYETNVMGTLNVYEAVRACESVRAVVSITTDKCYENREWVWGYRENDAMGGFDPYSSSKGCAEILSSAYRRSYFNPSLYGKAHQVALATARAGNVIGGGDWALDRLVPDCVRSLSKGEKIVIRSPGATRPWQHVMEPLSGYLRLAEYMFEDPFNSSEGWNFGPNDDGLWTVEEVVAETIKNWGSGHYECETNPGFHEANLLKLDVSKARAKLKWVPRMLTTEAINKTIEVYKRHYERQSSISELVSSQIHEYMKD